MCPPSYIWPTGFYIMHLIVYWNKNGTICLQFLHTWKNDIGSSALYISSKCYWWCPHSQWYFPPCYLWSHYVPGGQPSIISTSFSLKLPFHHPSRACALHYESVLWSLRDYVEFDAHFPSHETRRPQEHCTVWNIRVLCAENNEW